MNKREKETKEYLKKIAKTSGFQSVIFADEFKYSNREPLRYQLWMFELHQWLKDNYIEQVASMVGCEFFNFIDVKYLEVNLTVILENIDLTKNNILD